jgi:hypothetical protein
MADTLLDRILATVDDDRIFNMEGADDQAAARSRLREMILQVYTNAAATWDRHVVRIENDAVELRGKNRVVMAHRFPDCFTARRIPEPRRLIL